MKRSLLSLFAFGISLQAIPASLAEEIRHTRLTQSKESERINFSSLKPKSPMPILKSLPIPYATTTSDSYRFKPGVNLPKGRNSLSSNIVDRLTLQEKIFLYNSGCKTSFIPKKKILIMSQLSSSIPYSWEIADA